MCAPDPRSDVPTSWVASDALTPGSVSVDQRSQDKQMAHAPPRRDIGERAQAHQVRRLRESSSSSALLQWLHARLPRFWHQATQVWQSRTRPRTAWHTARRGVQSRLDSIVLRVAIGHRSPRISGCTDLLARADGHDAPETVGRRRSVRPQM
jgi:hypothetical protein